MFHKIEALGSRLLERLVPAVEASASAQDHCGSWGSCPRCNGRPCHGCCVTGGGCWYVCE